AQSVRQDGSGVVRPRDADRDVCRATSLPCKGGGDGPLIAGDRRADRVGMAATRGSDFQRLRRVALRPKERPNAAHIVHPKTGEEGWFPLFDDRCVPLYPELMAELDAIKRGAYRWTHAEPRLGRSKAVANMATARSARPNTHEPQG